MGTTTGANRGTSEIAVLYIVIVILIILAFFVFFYYNQNSVLEKIASSISDIITP